MKRGDGGPKRPRHHAHTIHELSTALKTRGNTCVERDWAKGCGGYHTTAIRRLGRMEGVAHRIQTLSTGLSTPCKHPAPARLKVALSLIVGDRWPQQHSDGNTYVTEDQDARAMNFQHRVQTPQRLAVAAILGVVSSRFF